MTGPSSMDIGVVIPILSKYGGAERYLIECLRRWQERHDITLYSAHVNDALLAEHGVTDRVKRSALTGRFPGDHAFFLNALLLPKIWRSEIGRHDIYHTHLWPTHMVDLHPMVWFPHEPLRLLHDLRYEQNVVEVGKQVAHQIHVYPKYHYDRLGDGVFEATLNAIDAAEKSARPECIVANSRYTAAYLENVYGVPVKDVVYPGIEMDDFIDLPTDPNLFVTVGQLWPHKRIALLIEAIALTDNTQLIVIGTGPEADRLRNLSRVLGVDNRVFFLSGLTNRELRLVLARACAFLFAAIREPFGIVVLEAMAAGKPVIAVDEGGFVEVTTAKSTFLVPPFPSAFAEKISLLQRDPALARRMGEAGRKLAPAYSWNKSASQLESILAGTLRDAEARRPAAKREIARRPLVGIQYYLWYGDGFGEAHWNDNPAFGYVSDKPLLGYYASSRGRTIDYHIDLFEQMGLDFVALNLHVDENGPNGLETVAIQHVFDVARRRGTAIRFAVQICPYGRSVPDAVNIVSVLERLYARDPLSFRYEGKPVLFWFWSSALDGDKAALAALAEAARGFTNIALSLRLPGGAEEARHTFGFFSGFAPYSPLELAEEKNWEHVWQTAYAQAKRAGMGVRLATISPGYDDAAMPDSRREGNPYRTVARRDGETYRRGMTFVESLEMAPHLVMITTFNEFHENSHIEPTLSIGRRYLDLTAEFVARLRDLHGSAK